jgi:UDP-glucose 4-epimerase
MNNQPTTDDPRPTILVTGGAGFIGSHIVDALIKENYQVVIIDNLSTGQKENINKKAKFYKVDITDKEKLAEVFAAEKPEAVFHLAAQASVIVSTKNPVKDVKTNIIGTINLLECCREHKVKKFIFSSTGGAIYGNKAPRPTPETYSPDPQSPYGIDKFTAEKYIDFYKKNYGLLSIILRYSNVFGPRQNPKGAAGVIAIFGSKMLKNEPIEVFGNGTQTRDYIYVSDVVAANLAALKSEISDVYNISNAKEIPLKQIIDELKNLTKTKSKIIFGKSNPGEQQRSALANEKAKKNLNWTPKISLKEGMFITVEYLKNSP